MIRHPFFKKSVYIIFALLLIFMVINAVSLFVKTLNSLDNDMINTFRISTEDSNLFVKDCWKNVKVKRVLNSKVRNPISIIEIKNEYNLLFYKVDINYEISLKKAALFTQKNINEKSSGYVYNLNYKDLPYDLQYCSGHIGRVSNFYITIGGESFKNISNTDTLISYELLLNNTTLKYEIDGPIDIYVQMNEKSKLYKFRHMQIGLYKKNGSVYLLLLTALDEKTIIPDNFLNNLLELGL